MYSSSTMRHGGMSFFVRNKYSFDFSLSRIVMKLFRTGYQCFLYYEEFQECEWYDEIF